MPSLAAARVDADVRIDNAFAIPVIQGSAEATGLTIGSIRLDTAAVTASLVDGATQFEASARGPDLDLSGSGSLADVSGAEVIRLTRLAGTAYGFPVNIASPATVRIDGGVTSVSGVNLAVGGGTVTVNGTVGADIDLRVAMNGVAAAFLERFSPGLGASGTISGSATVTGTPAAPRVAWRIDWAGFNVAAAAEGGAAVDDARRVGRRQRHVDHARRQSRRRRRVARRHRDRALCRLGAERAGAGHRAARAAHRRLERRPRGGRHHPHRPRGDRLDQPAGDQRHLRPGRGPRRRRQRRHRRQQHQRAHPLRRLDGADRDR